MLILAQVQFPRLSYPALLMPKLHAFFSPSLVYPDANPEDAWLEYDGVPLKWHYPCGLLYDLYSGAKPFGLDGDYEEKLGKEGRGEEGSEKEEGNKLPWRLTVHFSEYPVTQLVKLDAAGKVLRDLWVNCVKEVHLIPLPCPCKPPSPSQDEDEKDEEEEEEHGDNTD